MNYFLFFQVLNYYLQNNDALNQLRFANDFINIIECHFYSRNSLYLIILWIMKSYESINGSLALDSILSPPKNNKSTIQLDTMASLQFSDISQNQTYLKLNTIQKDYSPDLMASHLSKIEESVDRQDNLNENQQKTIQNSQMKERLTQLQLLQKWMCQACNAFYDGKIKIIDNEENIRKLEHKNRLKKDQVKHIKSMAEYLEQRANKMEKYISNRIRKYEQAIQEQIRLSQERAQNIFFQIKKLEQQIQEQKSLEKQLLSSDRSKQSKQQSEGQKIKRVSSGFSFNPQNHQSLYKKNNHNQQHHKHPYPSPPPHPGYPYPYYSPYPQYQYPHFNPYQHHPNHHYYYAHSQAQQSQQIPYTNSGPILKKSPSFETVATPEFVTKKNSTLQQNSYNPNPINNNLILQAMANNLKNMINPQISTIQSPSAHKKTNSMESQRLPSDLNLEMESPTYKKNGNQFPLTLSHLQQQYDENDPLYSPTNGITTPQFDIKMNKIRSFEEAFKADQKTAEKTQRSNILISSVKKWPCEQSKIRVDVDDSVSDVSKFSIEKRKRIDHNNIRQSTIKIQGIEDQSRSAQTSMLSDPNNTPRMRSPTVDPQINHNQSLQRMLEQQSSSEILSKPLQAPPRLPNQNKNKKLRKVTQQQSDLFDSNGDPRLQKKGQETYQVRQYQPDFDALDLVIDKSNIGVSQKYTPSIEALNQSRKGPFESSRIQNIEEKPQDFQAKSKISKKQPTDQDEDDEDFMNINLLAVSKISKQKQYSQGFKTISDDGNQIPEGKRMKPPNKNSAIHRSQNLMEHNNLKLPMDNIQEQQEFTDLNNIKRQAQMKRVRKSSGSRFSLLEQPRPESPTKV